MHWTATTIKLDKKNKKPKVGLLNCTALVVAYVQQAG